MNHPRTIACEILAPRAADGDVLAVIARTCARDTGQPITVKVVDADAPVREPVVTLRLPAELAASQHQVWCLACRLASQHQVWCLACRLACFCPQARVSVLVLGAASFDPPRARRHTAA